VGTSHHSIARATNHCLSTDDFSGLQEGAFGTFGGASGYKNCRYIRRPPLEPIQGTLSSAGSRVFYVATASKAIGTSGHVPIVADQREIEASHAQDSPNGRSFDP
jgi:hypothetical protein